jgi:hypothetical protein
MGDNHVSRTKVEKLTDEIAGLLTGIMPTTGRDIGRPRDIPLCVPDCGWNHGERKKIEEDV